MNGADLVKLIDKTVADTHDEKPRTHLGASVIGRKCPRQIWYGWRWFYHVKHTGRILRLFRRGHREEPEIVRWLRKAGLEVRTHSERLVRYEGVEGARYKLVPWEAPIPGYYDDVSESPEHLAIAEDEYGVVPQQFLFSTHRGHFGGSNDGLVAAFADNLEGPGNLECKTHGEKSFALVKAKGVLSAKLEHYVQMQVYMKFFELKWSLYIAVNKNTDEWYADIVHYKPEVADAYDDRAGKLVAADQPPQRITEDPSWWECKFCDFR
jgi:hypothetical protein